MRSLAAVTVLAALLAACSEREATENAAPEAPAAVPEAPPIPEFFVPPPLMPRGLIASEPGVADGYVLFNPTLSGAAYLVNNAGLVVHRWETPYSPGGDMELLPNGSLLRGARDPHALDFKVGGVAGILQELDWDGKVLWEWKLSDSANISHHDVTALPNGNVLVLAWETKSPAEATRAGRRVDWTPERGLFADVVLEIEPKSLSENRPGC